MNSEEDKESEEETEEELSVGNESTEAEKVPEDPIEKLKKEVDEKTKLSAEWKKKYMLLQAEFENYQKRMDKNRAHIQDIERSSILGSFLKIVDSFEKALEHMEANQSFKVSDVKLIYNQILNQFKSYKVEIIPTSIGDVFDYKIHEAISNIENPELPENSIIDVVQTGWKIANEVLRYAKVVVSKKPKKPEPKPEPEPESEPECDVSGEEENENADNLNENNNSENIE